MRGGIGQAITFLWLWLFGAQVAAAGVPAVADPAAPWTVEALFNRGAAPLRLGALPPDMGTPLAEECEGCHVAEAREWRDSRHRQAFTGALFQQAYRLEPMPECKNCHEPLSAGAPASKLVRALRREGITCAVCHVREGQVLAPRASGRAPHPVAVAQVLSTSEFCGGCHQFPFPDRRGDGAVHFTDEPMQDTLGEWQRGPATDTCQSCHMPLAATGRRSHRFPGGYDPAVLRRAVGVTAQLAREVDGAALTLTLETREVGHAVPTGDLYRSLVLSALPVDAAGRALGPMQEQRLARQFTTTLEADETGALRMRRRQIADDRLVPGEPRALRLQFSPPRKVFGIRYVLRLDRSPPGTVPGALGAGAISLIEQGEIR